ncbi:MAG: flagellar protein [Spirochaetota bacterium]|nr:MAG: flagellar protein [Spirochaetota bacterium]
MKRLLIITVSLLFVFSMSAILTQAQETEGGPKVLIDFQNLEDTEIDFSKFPGGIAEGIEEIKVDLSIPNWAVKLAPSSASPENRVLSKCQPVPSQSMNGDVMGVRVHFPTAPFNSWARIVPPFDIPIYEDAEGEEGEGTKFLNKGVLRNVGTIKSITVRVTGRNFPHSLSIALKDDKDQYQEMFLGNLDFEGWRPLVWDNPNYIDDVKQRDLRKTPLYPYSLPSTKFDSFIIYRHGSHVGGDFVTYFRDVQLVYDLAVIEIERDINDEAAWKILQTRRDAKRAAEIRRLGILQVLRSKELVKMQHAITAESE